MFILNLALISFKENDITIIYSPALDFSSYGNTVDEAKRSFEINLEEFIRYTTDLPDISFVHGDTSTSTAVALAAFYQQILIGHVEAGLRTHNIYSPWPEEMNRQITSRITAFHFTYTPLNK